MRVVAAIVGLGGLGLIFSAIGNAFWWLWPPRGDLQAVDPVSQHDVYFVKPAPITFVVLGGLAVFGVCQLVLSLWSFRALGRQKGSKKIEEPA